MTASDFEGLFDPETIRKNFYVDDCLKSVQSRQEAIKSIEELCELLAKQSFHLTKFISNNREVIESVPEIDCAKSVANLDLGKLPVERALGCGKRCIHLQDNQEKECLNAQRDFVCKLDL